MDVRTGEEAVGRTAAGFGGAMADLGIRFDVMEGKAQADVAERDVRLSWVDTINALQQEDDVSKWDSIFETHNQKTSVLTPKNRRGARQYNAAISRLTPVWRERYLGLKSAKLDDNMIAASIVKRNDLMNSVTVETMPQVIQKIKTELEVLDRLSPSISREATERAKISVEHDVQLSIAKRMALGNPEAALANIEGDKFIGLDALTPDDILRIRNMANSTITQAKIATKQKDDAIGGGFLDLLINKLDPTKPQLTFEMIAASDLSFDAKMQWESRLRTFDNYSEVELQEAFTDKGEVLADIYNKIDNNTLTDELDTMVGRGLSPTTAQRIKKEIRAPYEKDTDQLLKRIFGWSPELGFENDLSAFLYEKTLREWQAEVKRQDATGEKIVEIGKSIARPYFIEHLEKTMMGQEADIARMVDLALGEEVEEIKVEEKPKEDEGPKTYIDFENEVARLKKIDMGKARTFYDAWIGKFRVEKEEGGKTEKVKEEKQGGEKGVGFLGELSLPGGGVATEYSISTTDVTGEEMSIPTLVPTLTTEEIGLMVNDIIPNLKKVPDRIIQKAIAYAKERLREGRSVFAETEEKIDMAIKAIADFKEFAEKGELEQK